MAERYGGKYSPTGNRPAAGAPHPQTIAAAKPRGLWRSRVLFLSALAFLFPAFGDDPRDMLMGLAAGGLLVLSAWLTRQGQYAEAAYAARKLARRPAIPRKLFGAVLTGAALAVGGIIAEPGLLYPTLFALVGAGLHLLSFGLDPMSDKGMEGIDAFQTGRVAHAVEEGEKHLAAMKDAILRARDRQLEARVDRFASAARSLFRTVEGDPGDLTAARKYLSVYLIGARDATIKFADHYAQTRDTQARADYEALLTDLETTFASRTTALLSNSRTDLDVEISVLRDRLKLDH
ncbi:MAG: 5-bromo-4-chloroindolyl phosphate hydrolysis family protein [Tabrizicola sp.]|uniref:5-bromo-4-chloroindolyl phosphate hydrolysis family protein n=1 Tax=Tabrizicola sp. TaxID=2005166 RepID=UPI002734E3B0|nr:5-bromo-4-chloroindolyl phosphate hydrolysis family protein [Tabrizicola sp.]MDP3263039.1 5-bromo-4-chloroindolyl phosphate hydrolysis family protein [Tabrizicola sp.]MDP3648574.1 5-bromo-4-chloroindolyl phosphate hydrolysis family protein [Paracoccaceae bacterium]MDZ4070085.1 5-bromo-4-chloroindolyl phosphate hydrolysis family protein [Tabrizicola sp.]